MAWWAVVFGAAAGPVLVRWSDRWCPARAGRRALLAGAVGLAGAVALLGPTPYALLAALAVPLVRIDLAVHRLPDALVLPAYPLVAVFLPSWRGACAAGVCLLGYAVLCAAGGLGFGDAKLGGLLGLALGALSWPAVATGVAAGLALGAAYAMILVLGRRATWGTPVAYGPALLLGALVAVLLHGT